MSSNKQTKKKGKTAKKGDTKVQAKTVQLEQKVKQEQIANSTDNTQQQKAVPAVEENKDSEQIEDASKSLDKANSQPIDNETAKQKGDVQIINNKEQKDNQNQPRSQQQNQKTAQQDNLNVIQIKQEVKESKEGQIQVNARITQNNQTESKNGQGQVVTKDNYQVSKTQLVEIQEITINESQNHNEIESKQQKTHLNVPDNKQQLSEEKKSRDKASESPQPITLIDSAAVGSNQDLDQETSKQSRVKKGSRLAKFKQKQKKYNSNNEQTSPSPQKPIVQQPKKQHIITSAVSNIKSKFTRAHHDIQQLPLQKDMDEYKMLLVMIQSKKKQNYKTLKQWDDKRIENLSLHLNITDGFERTLDNLARTSFENIEIYFSTFRQIYNQQEKFASHPMIDTAYTTKHNSLSQNIYINCSCILNALNQDNMERAKKAKQFGQLIKTNILDDIFDQHLKKTQQLLTQIKSRISALKTVLINTQVESDKRSEKLAHSFANNLMQLDQNKNQDFYQLELEFLRLSHSIVDIHKQYAELILQYYEVVRDIEVERSQAIKKAIKVYSQAIENQYQSKTGYQSLQQLAKGEQSLLIDEFFSVQELIPANFQQLIKHKQKISQQGFKLDFLKEYFKNFHIEQFNLRQLILKQYPVTNQTSNIQNSTLIITVDKFVHVFSSLQNYTQAVATYKIDELLKIKRKGNQVTLEILPQKRSGVLGMFGWSSKGSSSLTLLFAKKDSAEQAEDYINKLI